MANNIDKIKSQLEQARKTSSIFDAPVEFITFHFRDIEHYDGHRCFPTPIPIGSSARKDCILCPPESDCHCAEAFATVHGCKTCRAQFRAMDIQKTSNFLLYAKQVSDSEASHRLEKLTNNINANVSFLRLQVQDHGDAILKQWKKGKNFKNKDKKAGIFRATMPTLSVEKIALPGIYFERRNWYDTPQDRTKWLLPYLSVEALQEDPMRIMHLLHVRTSYDPEHFTSYDNKHLDAGWDCGGLQIEFNAHAIGLCGKQFGKLVPYEQGACHRLTCLGYPRARLLLEAQDRLYSFLRKVVESILHDVKSVSGSNRWYQLMCGSQSPVSPLYADRPVSDPFCALPVFPAEALCDLVDTQMRAAEDELELLQTDPAMVQHYLQRANGTLLSQASDVKFKWSNLVPQIVSPAVRRVDFWHCLSIQCHKVKDTVDEENTRIRNGHNPSAKLHGSAFLLQTLCYQVGSHLAERCMFAMIGNEAFKKYFRLKRLSDGRLAIVLISKSLVEQELKVYQEDRIFWAVNALQNSFTIPPPPGPPFNSSVILEVLYDSVERSSASSSHVVDEQLHSVVSDLARIEQLSWAILTMKPCLWGLGDFNNIIWSLGPEDRKALSAMRAREFEIDGASEAMLGSQLERLSQCGWPKGQKDECWLQHATQARQLLHDFWANYRECRLRSMEARDGAREKQIVKPDESSGIGLLRINETEIEAVTTWKAEAKVFSEALEQVTELLSADRTPRYLAELAAERWSIDQGIARRKTRNKIFSIIDIAPDWTSILPEKTVYQTLAPKSKAKTRPLTAQGDALNQHEHLLVEDGSEDTTAVPVKPHNLTVFKQMFPGHDDAPAKRGAVDWQHFLAAMIDAGFAVSQSRGSAVTFRREDGAIVFHRPHPDPKIEWPILHAMGRRLSKWFGWSRETFVEMVKKERKEEDEE